MRLISNNRFMFVVVCAHIFCAIQLYAGFGASKQLPEDAICIPHPGEVSTSHPCIDPADQEKLFNMALNEQPHAVRKMIQQNPALAYVRDSEGRGLIYYLTLNNEHRGDNAWMPSPLVAELVVTYKAKISSADVMRKEGDLFCVRAINPRGDTLLHYAALKAPSLIKPCVEAGIDPNVRNNKNKTPLYRLIMRTSMPDNGLKNPDAYKASVIHRIKELCTLGASLEEKKGEKTKSYVVSAINAGVQPYIVKALLDSGAPVHEALYAALCEKDGDQYIELLQPYTIKLEDPEKIVCVACFADGYFERAVPFVSDWNAVNSRRRTPLAHATRADVGRMLEVMKYGGSPHDLVALSDILCSSHKRIDTTYTMLACLLANGMLPTDVCLADFHTSDVGNVVAQGTSVQDYALKKLRQVYGNTAAAALGYALIESRAKFAHVWIDGFDAFAQKCADFITHTDDTVSESNEYTCGHEEVGEEAQTICTLMSKIPRDVFSMGTFADTSVLARHIEQLPRVADLVRANIDDSIMKQAMQLSSVTLVKAMYNRIKQSLVQDPVSNEYKDAQYVAQELIYKIIKHQNKLECTEFVAYLIELQPKDWRASPDLWKTLCTITKASARVNAFKALHKYSSIDAYNEDGQTLLMLRLHEQACTPECISACVASGADVNKPALTTGITALHIAVLLGKPHFVRALIEAGADMHQKDAAGISPYMLGNILVYQLGGVTNYSHDVVAVHNKACAVTAIMKGRNCIEV